MTIWMRAVIMTAATLATSAGEMPAIDDAAILKLMPGGTTYSMPERIFPPGPRAGREESFGTLVTGDARRAADWLAIPESAWQELITDFAPVSMHGTNTGVGGRDPFTGDDYFDGVEMSHEDFLKTPFQARAKDGGEIVYERESDMPADWKWRPNHTAEIPHLDGTTHAYRFLVPEAFAGAGTAYNSERRHWFCPAGEVYGARLRIIMSAVLPDLIAAVYHDTDPRAARQLAVILDRVADVYPGLPLLSASLAHGFARSPDKSGYLTAALYDEITSGTPPPGYDFPPPWWHGIYDYNYAKLNGKIPGWTDGVLAQLGTYAIAFDLLHDLEAVRAFSQEKYGDPERWTVRVRERLLEPARLLARFSPPTKGNTAYAYVMGAVPLGIVTQDSYLFATGLSIPELYLYNNWMEDGMPIDGAFNYALMTYGIIKYRWMYEELGGSPLHEKFPLLHKIDSFTFRPVTTLYNLASKHADEHARFFRSRRPWMPPPDPAALPYEAHERSQSLPVYGLTALRGGAPGSRLELILDHQNTNNHVHESKLNVQLFYEGVELLPDFGYSVAFAFDPEAAPWKDFDYPHQLLPTPEPRDKWGPWRHQYAIHPEAHCVATIDNWLASTIPMTLEAYHGGTAPESPAWQAQFVDASAKGLFHEHPAPVDLMRRQLAVITLPNGRSLALDFFRLRGGKRHDLYWHVPSDTMPSTLGEGEPVEAASLAELWNIKTDYYNGKASRHYGYALRQIRPQALYPMPSEVWQADFHVQPANFLPRSPGVYTGNEARWPKLLTDRHLRLWSWADGSDADQEILTARGPWPGLLEEINPETEELMLGLGAFKDALAFVIESRLAQEPGLESSYFHVLEPRTPDQSPLLAATEVLQRDSVDVGGGLVARLTLTDGTTLLVASTLNGEATQTEGFALNGRFGMAIPAIGNFVILDGVHLQADDWRIDLAPTWKMTLAGVIGDLTGSPDQAALLVTSDRPLPVDQTLIGQHIQVDHQAGPYYKTTFTIARISVHAEGMWRVDLQDTPTFMQNRMHVMAIDPEKPRSLQPEFRLYRGSGEVNYRGRRVRFPRTGYETTVASGTWKELLLAEDPPDDMVQAGDPFVIYTIQPGDAVTIRSSFASRGIVTPEGIDLDIQASGPFDLHVPAFSRCTIGERTIPATPEGLRLSVTADDLTDGRLALRLFK